MAVGLSGCSYNKFTTQEEAIKAQWGEVQNQIQRRNDLIPNLVEIGEGLRGARGGHLQGRSPTPAPGCWRRRRRRKRSQAANQQSSALGRLLVVVENYPQPEGQRAVQSPDGRARRHREPAGDRARCATTSASRSTTRQRRRFPGNVTAKMFGFKEYPYCEAPADAQAVAEGRFQEVDAQRRSAVNSSLSRLCLPAIACRATRSHRVEADGLYCVSARAGGDRVCARSARAACRRQGFQQPARRRRRRSIRATIRF